MTYHIADVSKFGQFNTVHNHQKVSEETFFNTMDSSIKEFVNHDDEGFIKVRKQAVENLRAGVIIGDKQFQTKGKK